MWTQLQPPPHSSAAASVQGCNSQTPGKHKGWLSLTWKENCKQRHLVIKEMNHLGKEKKKEKSKKGKRYFTEFTWRLCSIFSNFTGYHTLTPGQMMHPTLCSFLVTSTLCQPMLAARRWFCDIWSGFYYLKGNIAGHQSGWWDKISFPWIPNFEFWKTRLDRTSRAHGIDCHLHVRQTPLAYIRGRDRWWNPFSSPFHMKICVSKEFSSAESHTLVPLFLVIKHFSKQTWN